MQERISRDYVQDFSVLVYYLRCVSQLHDCKFNTARKKDGNTKQKTNVESSSKNVVTIHSDDSETEALPADFQWFQVDNQTDYSFNDNPQLRRGNGKIYVTSLIFNSIAPVKVKVAPDHLGGICVYGVSLRETLQDCKEGRTWGSAKSSKSVSFVDGRRLFLCRGN